ALAAVSPVNSLFTMLDRLSPYAARGRRFPSARLANPPSSGGRAARGAGDEIGLAVELEWRRQGNPRGGDRSRKAFGADRRGMAQPGARREFRRAGTRPAGPGRR